jgi:hypothetical protein
MQSAPREGTECYLKQPASARRGTQPPLRCCFDGPGSGSGALPGCLSWSAVVWSCLCACVCVGVQMGGRQRWRSPLNLDPAHQ